MRRKRDCLDPDDGFDTSVNVQSKYPMWCGKDFGNVKRRTCAVSGNFGRDFAGCRLSVMNNNGTRILFVDDLLQILATSKGFFILTRNDVI